MYIYLLKGINFKKDYQKDSYNERIFIEKNIDDKNILTTLIIFKMWNFKTLKIQRMFQNFRTLKIFYCI
jgi:hypothetical protein